MDDGSREAPALSVPAEEQSALTFEYPNSELVFGIVCAVGGNYRKVQNELKKCLEQHNYQTELIRMSGLVGECYKRLKINQPIREASEAERILSLDGCRECGSTDVPKTRTNRVGSGFRNQWEKRSW